MDAEKRKYAHEIGTINTLCATTAFLSEKIGVLEEVNATSRNIIDKVGAGKIIYKNKCKNMYFMVDFSSYAL